MRNLGPRSRAWLEDAGIRSLEELRAAGALAAWQRVKRAGHPASLNLLYALAGAIADCDWRALPQATRSGLLRQADAAEDALRRDLCIVSGGQTGADRAALDAALEAGARCGGWCPAGRRAEDGPIDARYPLRETGSREYRERTERNVLESDATLIVSFGALSGGSAVTESACREHGKPVLVIDAGSVRLADALRRLRRFLTRYAVRVLNVAGPRASKQPDIHAWVKRLIAHLLAAGT